MMEDLTQCNQYTLNYFGMLNLPEDKKVSVYMDKELENSVSIMQTPMEAGYSSAITFD